MGRPGRGDVRYKVPETAAIGPGAHRLGGRDLRPCRRRRARPSVTKMSKAGNTAPDLAERAGYLVEVAARAPSVHNTQPWRFTVTGQAIDLYADTSRQLLEDPA